MARPYKTTYVDEDGKKIQRGFRSGIVETVHTDVTPEYQHQKLDPIMEQYRKEKKQREKDSKIQAKLKEMAEKELEKEGKL